MYLASLHPPFYLSNENPNTALYYLCLLVKLNNYVTWRRGKYFDEVKVLVMKQLKFFLSRSQMLC